MTDLGILIKQAKKREMPMDLPEAIQKNAELWDEYKHFPYYQPLVQYPGGPKTEIITHDYSKDPLTFKILTNGSVCGNFIGTDPNEAQSLLYSIDNGKTGETLNLTVEQQGKGYGGYAEIPVSAGDIIMFKHDGYLNGTADDNSVMHAFSSESTLDVCGNIMSLIDSNSYSTITTIQQEYTYTFCYLFNGMDIINAKDLILPATTLANHCYLHMFGDCSDLITAPKLPATILADFCYAYMFDGCSNLEIAPDLPATILTDDCYRCMFSECLSLNYIKCLATDMNANDSLANWVDGVASSGTFIRDENASGLVDSVDGIPTGGDIQPPYTPPTPK